MTKKSDYPPAPGKKLKFGGRVRVDITGAAGRYPLDNRPDSKTGDVRIVVNGRWFVWVMLDTEPPVHALVPAESVTKE